MNYLEHDDEIKRYVERVETETLMKGDTSVYDECVEKMKNICLRNITEGQVKAVLDKFLVKWGWMSRVVHHPANFGWEQPLACQLQAKSNSLEFYRTSDLSSVNLTKVEPLIETSYEELSAIVKRVSSAKTLHLICPGFFPPWDRAIERTFRNIWLVTRGGHIRAKAWSGTDYFNFMQQIQAVLNNHLETWSRLGSEYGRSKVKMVDKYLWSHNGLEQQLRECLETHGLPQCRSASLPGQN